MDSDGSDKDMVAFLKESKSGGEAKKPQPEDPEAPPIVDGKLRVNLLGSSMQLGYYVALKNKLNDTRIKN